MMNIWNTQECKTMLKFNNDKDKFIKETLKFLQKGKNSNTFYTLTKDNFNRLKINMGCIAEIYYFEHSYFEGGPIQIENKFVFELSSNNHKKQLVDYQQADAIIYYMGILKDYITNIRKLKVDNKCNLFKQICYENGIKVIEND